jgi:hypothetical protein
MNNHFWIKPVESRGATRVEVRLEGRVLADTGPCPVRVTNLSSNGIRLEGSRQLVDTVLPNQGGDEAMRRKASVDVLFFLDDERNQAVVVQCQSVYVRRLRPDWFQMGMFYTLIDSASQQLLEDFIRQAAEKDPG